MQISSSYASGLVGVQGAQTGLTQATIDVAQPVNPSLQAGETMSVEPVEQTQAIVSAVEYEKQAEAAVEVIATSSETLGTMINLEV